MKNWSLNAVEYEAVKDSLIWPMLGQPKLNGIRAVWNGDGLWSRQGKKWSWKKLPHIYAKLREWSVEHPGVILDGELYCHGMPFQDIEARTSINSESEHPDSGRIDFHAFDIISEDRTEERQITLSQIYKPWVAVCRVANVKDCEMWLNRFYEAGFEGLMLRQYDCPYRPGRSEMLVKIKPWKYGRGIIVGYREGEGKYKGTLGALEIRMVGSGKHFFVSGGLSDEERDELFRRRIGDIAIVRYLDFKCRDYSNDGIPLQPQIVRYDK